MLKDISGMNPKGHVKLELYNEAGEVTFTKEKRNLVVLDANKIVANMMAQPSRKTRIADQFVGDTEFNSDGAASLTMAQHREEVVTTTINLGSSAVAEFQLENSPYITQIISATINEASAVVGQRVFIKDGPKGIIGFDGIGATGAVVIKFRKVINDMVDIIQGSEIVTIGGSVWSRGLEANDSTQTYKVEYKTGEITFENPKANVSVEYEYEMQYSLGFMGIGGLPQGHPDGQPVAFSRNDKFRTKLDNEYIGSRQPINFPLTIEEGRPEIDVLLAKDISAINRNLRRVEVVGNVIEVEGVEQEELTFDYVLDVSTIDGDRPLLEITRAEVVSGTLVGRDLLLNSEVTIVDRETGAISIAPTLADEGLVRSDVIEFDYKLKAGTGHLVYQLNYSPVVELRAVRYENNLGSVINIPVDGATKGMDFGTNGKVRVLNANAGTIEFKPEFEQHLVNNPGKVTVEYFVNSGTVVNFIADFPKGVPGPVLVRDLEYIPDTSSGVVEYNLPHVVETINEIRINGEPTLQFSVNGSKVTINDPNFRAGDILVIRYDTESSTHTIYTVAMFDQINEQLSNMFNISGIGPVTKDKNTGMRITWSVTF